jgi:hypothetical protein
VVVDVVVTVTVAATGLALATFTELVTPHVAGLTAPDGMVVTAQVRLTVPVNPPLGDTLMVDVFPVVAAAAMEMFPPLLSVKLGGRTKAVTVTPTTVVLVREPELPVTVTA